MDDGPAAIDDAEVDAQIPTRARRVYVQSAIAALVLTAVVLAIPGRG